ncbi:MAG: acyl-CoA/acyl-ACP dehydrogenase [Acidobacteriota bacterium]|jgi:alkylation response protein AidB-like acyl-CoA dehydrogenase|nr:acyl-CoA/acyl-ACP dehydrogenase [Acidobacteriota bacterium]
MSNGFDKEMLDGMLDSLKKFTDAHLPDTRILELDATEEFPVETIREMCNPEVLGIQLLFIPEEFEGMGGGAFDVYRVCEELARVDLGVATGVLATFLGSDPIIFGGTYEQKKLWMTRIGQEGLLMAYGATEPAAGSDLGALRTVAVPVEENGVVKGYKITGNKQWISNGGYADL